MKAFKTFLTEARVNAIPYATELHPNQVNSFIESAKQTADEATSGSPLTQMLPKMDGQVAVKVWKDENGKADATLLSGFREENHGPDSPVLKLINHFRDHGQVTLKPGESYTGDVMHTESPNGPFSPVKSTYTIKPEQRYSEPIAIAVHGGKMDVASAGDVHASPAIFLPGKKTGLNIGRHLNELQDLADRVTDTSHQPLLHDAAMHGVFKASKPGEMVTDHVNRFHNFLRNSPDYAKQAQSLKSNPVTRALAAEPESLGHTARYVAKLGTINTILSNMQDDFQNHTYETTNPEGAVHLDASGRVVAKTVPESFYVSRKNEKRLAKNA